MDLKPRHLNHKYLKGHFSIYSFRSYVFYRKPSIVAVKTLALILSLRVYIKVFFKGQTSNNGWKMKFGIKGCNSNFHQLQEIPMEFRQAAGSTDAKNSENTHILMNCQPGLNVTSILNRRSHF